MKKKSYLVPVIVIVIGCVIALYLLGIYTKKIGKAPQQEQPSTNTTTQQSSGEKTAFKAIPDSFAADLADTGMLLNPPATSVVLAAEVIEIPEEPEVDPFAD